jgi:hypothetical protein
MSTLLNWGNPYWTRIENLARTNEIVATELIQRDDIEDVSKFI